MQLRTLVLRLIKIAIIATTINNHYAHSRAKQRYGLLILPERNKEIKTGRQGLMQVLKNPNNHILVQFSKQKNPHNTKAI